MNLTEKYRPRDFSEVVGQAFAVSILKGIIRNKEKAPRCLVFEGAWGTGKTTLARCFARALNGFPKEYDIDNSPLYLELDSAVVGNVETVKGMRDSLSQSYVSGIKVVVFDEAHAISKAAQAALLKPLEQYNPGIFYIFVTTEVDQLLKTIISRSLQISFELVPASEMIRNLTRVSKNEKLTIPDGILDIIVGRSGGHVRDSLMLLDKYLLVGNEEFKSNVFLLDSKLLNLFSLTEDSQAIEKVKEIVSNPLVYVRCDLERFIMEGVKGQVASDGVFKNVKLQNLLKLFSFYVSNKQGAFTSSSDAFSFILSIYRIFMKLQGA